MKEVSAAISANAIIVNNHSSMGILIDFQFCAYNNLTAILIYKNKIPWLFSSCLSIKPKRMISFVC